MLIIAKEPAANGSYPPLQPWAGQTPPEGYYQIKDGLDTSVFQEHSGFVILTVIRGIVTAMDPNTAALEAWQAAASAAALPARKLERIAESKQQLADYLLCHPMQWTDGQRYAITAEKQQQLTSKIMSATLAAQTSTPYSLTWNATGQECQSWTLENLTALAFAIDARVTGLVSYQQAQEVAMRDAPTLEALEAIPVDYDSVPLPGGETA